ncbi:hypothetical protein [Micromonospora sp. NPDC005710]|uniref:hypothetical protein n=1 Tax=Micromonospora sp. NPDC005710 TaxID=3157051 RepID=UPI0033EAE8EA
MASGFKINKQGIRKMAREIEREFAKTPVRLPVNGEIRATSGAGDSAVTGSELGLVAGWLLDWGFTYSNVKPGLVPSVSEMMTDVGTEGFESMVRPHVEVAVALLEEAGLLNGSAKTYGSQGMNLPVWLTDSGRREAASRIERRKDNRSRRSACRDALLRWVYERDATGESTEITEIATSPYGWFNGILFTAADLAEAVEYLRERRLLGGMAERLSIAPAGTECIEQYGSVVEYLNRRDAAGVNVMILGDNNGQLAVGNRDVAQDQTNTNQEKALAVFVNALREFGQLVPASQQPEYEEVAAALEREAAKAEPNRGWVEALFDRVTGLLEGAPPNLQNLAQVMKVAFDIYGQTAGWTFGSGPAA